MRTFGKWLGRTLLFLVLSGVLLYVWKREEITRVMAVNSLFAGEKIVNNFSHMNSLFLSTPMPRGDGPVSPIVIGQPIELPDSFETWAIERAVTGVVVLKDGLLRHEAYYLGTGPDDLRISWSVAKSFLSALMGVMLDQGKIASLQDPVTKYAPTLIGTAYDGATIEDVLQMESGVKFNEDYFDFWSDINKMGRVLALGQSMDSFAAGIDESISEPGEAWKYVSIDTHVLSMVIRGATDTPIATLLSEHIIAPLGLEKEPYYVTDGHETAFVLGGLNLTTRDYARFGQMVAQNGLWDGTQVVPAAWIAESTRPSAKTAEGNTQYGYQWWMPADARQGEFFARGVYGQYIYINQPLGVVIAINSADKNFRDAGVTLSNIAMFRALAEATQ
ncbi:serine hydrolase domain-containing protein [Lentibacter sp. XHP0401]|uniref:serine hydrolase domain-containing protein n=1 Tax=Lentibacter sp. XHP0401 TaxID=2984334 RepID=UPI0021E74D1A|nr:serine hydrolase [Lentibacter sp. XHP0401]MCV2894526.1 beta-lactamase family protein [Lentibacter sp. XHP0401]